ncbi:MAG: hypothetical protein KC613_10815, partial [Myxococcales bacterium]|nr:hypothetical protein [Myxococcales bacterium]
DQSPADQSPADQSPAAPVPVPAVVGVPSVVEPVAEQPARPEPPPQPRPQAPGEALLGALPAALGRMRREAPRAFDGVDLHRLGVVTGSRKGPPLHLDRGGVTLDLAHPWVAAAAADPRPERVALLACLIHGAWVEGRPGEARLEAKAVTAAAHWLRGALPAEVP